MYELLIITKISDFVIVIFIGIISANNLNFGYGFSAKKLKLK
ncbi:hypothetical protein MENTO_v1c06690 [Mesoplasma entomophilum]|nr:hypothetical protein [Mesoplasma entomophilum]ATZ19770.1 hypothetical protein MENTO_v1c06690 [Mesoplasma entomophilum]